VTGEIGTLYLQGRWLQMEDSNFVVKATSGPPSFQSTRDSTSQKAAWVDRILCVCDWACALYMYR
jgi:hypothetical protein